MKIWTMLLFFIILVYVVSPIDLMPEILLGPIGYIDDAFAIMTALFVFLKGM